MIYIILYLVVGLIVTCLSFREILKEYEDDDIRITETDVWIGIFMPFVWLIVLIHVIVKSFADTFFPVE